jgi:hypothetical protein
MKLQEGEITALWSRLCNKVECQKKKNRYDFHMPVMTAGLLQQGQRNS